LALNHGKIYYLEYFMTEELAQYWGRLTGAVHPFDADTFRRVGNHGFNLQFPPPAFIGDVLNAPVIILDNNGGYDPVRTPSEFPDLKACDEYRTMLSAPRRVNPTARSMSRYYLERNYSAWLISGEAALVNGVAYRSVDGKAAAVGQLTSELPSARFHQKWLREILVPLAQRGERFVVVHRWGRWNNATNALRGLPTTIFSPAPRSKNLTAKEVAAVQRFLTGRETL
jgi:hypothetical protein